MYIVFIFMAFIFLLIGIVIKHYKCYFLIAGYNTMTKEQQAKVDIEKTGNIVGNFGYAMFFIQILASILGYFNYEILAFMISFISILSGVVVILIKSEEYDGNDRNPDGSLKKGKKIMISVISVFFTAVVIGVSVLMFSGNKASDIIIGNNDIEIKGMYGTDILIDNIKEVTLEESIPRIIAKTNGSNLGSKLKGNFKLEELGKVKLFIDKDKPPFIFIKSDQGYIIINLESRQATEDIYKKIKEKLNEK
ncbi:MAG: DUF3784 domain-containing protein [Bacillota bacterium]|nr:DUF3784 domain-containing protein [Bacillota bacterium]